MYLEVKRESGIYLSVLAIPVVDFAYKVKFGNSTSRNLYIPAYNSIVCGQLKVKYVCYTSTCVAHKINYSLVQRRRIEGRSTHRGWRWS